METKSNLYFSIHFLFVLQAICKRRKNPAPFAKSQLLPIIEIFRLLIFFCDALYPDNYILQIVYYHI